MTFYAFREDGKLFLARQIESESPKSSDAGVPATKESNLRALHDTAKSLGVDELLNRPLSSSRHASADTAGPASRPIPTHCRRRRIPERRRFAPTRRCNVLTKKPGSLTLGFTPLAAKGAPDAAEEFCRQAPPCRQKQEPQLRDRTHLRQ